MAALRAQLEAMQAQRQQGAAAPGAAAQLADVFDALDRLHERLREAEESRDGVVAQVKELKRQCQVRVKCNFST